MVLPASTPHPAPAPGAWLQRLSLILRLNERGVLVLLDRARPERLGELVRHLLREYPDTEVLTEAPALARMPVGSTVVLCVRAADAGWLNQERPVVQARELRVLLFSDEETTTALSRQAVDFYDWISHRIDCPDGPPAFAVRALRRAACARASAVVWEGGNLDASFSVALPGRTLERVSAAQPYASLVEALKPKARTWIAITDLDLRLRVRRAFWAAAETRRLGRMVLVESTIKLTKVPWAHGQALSVEDATKQLREAGVERAARLAAVLELEPHAIEEAVRLARAGKNEAELQALALGEGPGVTLGHTSQKRGRWRLPDWPARIDLALQAGDVEVAARWAMAWSAESGGSVSATAALARVRAREGMLSKARALLDEARLKVEAGTDDDTLFELERADGLLRFEEGDFEGAISSLGKALDFARHPRRPIPERNELCVTLIGALIGVGRLDKARLLLDEWHQLLCERGITPERNPLFARAVATLNLALGDSKNASKILEELHASRPVPEHSYRDSTDELLARAWIEVRRYREAEELLHEAMDRFERLGRPTTTLRYEYGRVLIHLGRFPKAEQELRRVLEEEHAPERLANTRYLLALCLKAQGRVEEAETLIDESLSELQQNGMGKTPPFMMALHEKARILNMYGDHTGALERLRETLKLEEEILGRETSTLVLPTLVDLGTTLVIMGKANEAEPLLRRAAHLAEQAKDLDGHALALAELARAQAAQGFQHARGTARRSLEAWQAAGNEPSPALQQELEAIAAGAFANTAKTSPPRRPKRR